jgi:hypothetical protein
MHLLANRVMLEHLTTAGIFTGTEAEAWRLVPPFIPSLCVSLPLNSI